MTDDTNAARRKFKIDKARALASVRQEFIDLPKIEDQKTPMEKHSWMMAMSYLITRLNVIEAASFNESPFTLTQINTAE